MARPGRTWLLIGLAVALAIVVTGVVVVAYASATVAGNVFAVGPSIGGPLATGERTIGGARYATYCASPGGRFAAPVFLRNDGPLPITLKGGDPGPGGPVSDTVMSNGFSLADLAIDDGGAIGGANATDPLAARVLPPTHLEPGQTITTWARFREGPQADLITDQGYFYVDQIWVRISVIGIERVVPVSLSIGVAITGGCSPSSR